MKSIEKIYELRAQQKLNSEVAIDLTHEAMKRKDIFIIELLAETHPKVVTEILEIDHSGLDLILESSSLIFQIKDYLTSEDRELLLKKIVPKLMEQAERIYNLINRSRFPNWISYSPGSQWDVEKTIENFLVSGDSNFTYKHVICLDQKEKIKNIILVIDKSHSVLVYLKLIILTSILFCMSIKFDDIAIVTFDTESELLKTFSNSTLTLDNLIHKISNLSSGGKTNIYSALELAEKELSRRISKKKTLVLISD
ncbi:MAG: vWA domain-containing protein, partial [Candidatus Hodarchaeales archaeon]